MLVVIYAIRPPSPPLSPEPITNSCTFEIERGGGLVQIIPGLGLYTNKQSVRTYLNNSFHKSTISAKTERLETLLGQG